MAASTIEEVHARVKRDIDAILRKSPDGGQGDGGQGEPQDGQGESDSPSDGDAADQGGMGWEKPSDAAKSGEPVASDASAGPIPGNFRSELSKQAVEGGKITGREFLWSNSAQGIRFWAHQSDNGLTPNGAAILRNWIARSEAPKPEEKEQDRAGAAEPEEDGEEQQQASPGNPENATPGATPDVPTTQSKRSTATRFFQGCHGIRRDGKRVGPFNLSDAALEFPWTCQALEGEEDDLDAYRMDGSYDVIPGTENEMDVVEVVP